MKTLKILEHFRDHEYLSFYEFIKKCYGSPDDNKLINELKIGKNQNMIHVMSKQNHYYLLDSLSKEIKNQIDINNLDNYGNSPLQIAIEHKNV